MAKGTKVQNGRCVLVCIAFALVLLLLGVTALSFAVFVSQYNDASVHSGLIKRQNYRYFFVNLPGNELQSYFEEGIVGIRTSTDEHKLLSNDLYFSSKEEAEAHGIRFYTSDVTPLSATVYYLSDVLANFYISQGYLTCQNGVFTRLSSENDVTDLVGATICRDGNTTGNVSEPVEIVRSGVCGGIYYADATEGDDVLSYGTQWRCGAVSMPQNLQFSNTNQTITVGGKRVSELNVATNVHNEFWNSAKKDNGKVLLLKDDGSVTVFDMCAAVDGSIIKGLAENETYVTLSTYNTVFGTNYAVSDIFEQDASQRFVAENPTAPQEIGSTVNVELQNGISQEKVTADLKIKGILFSVEADAENPSHFTFDQLASTFCLYLNETSATDSALWAFFYYGSEEVQSAWIQADSVKNLNAFVRKICNVNQNDNYAQRKLITPYTFNGEDSVSGIMCGYFTASLVVGLVLLAVYAVLLATSLCKLLRNNFLCASAEFQGVSTKNYLLALLFTALAVAVLATLVIWLLATGLNAVLASCYVLGILTYRWYNALITLGISLVALFAVGLPFLCKVKLSNDQKTE